MANESLSQATQDAVQAMMVEHWHWFTRAVVTMQINGDAIREHALLGERQEAAMVLPDGSWLAHVRRESLHELAKAYAVIGKSLVERPPADDEVFIVIAHEVGVACAGLGLTRAGDLWVYVPEIVPAQVH